MKIFDNEVYIINYLRLTMKDVKRIKAFLY